MQIHSIRLAVRRVSPYDVLLCVSALLIALHLTSSSGFAREPSAGVSQQGRSLDQALLAAIDRGSYEDVSKFLNTGASPNAADPRGDTALMYAGGTGQIDTVEFLIERGARVNATAEFGISPLHAAIIFGDPEIVRLLIEEGADVHVRGGRSPTADRVTPLELARMRYDSAPERRLSDRRARGRLLLHSIKSDYEAIIRMLVREEARQGHTLQYPSPGSPDPGIVCERALVPAWLDFFCHFFTEELWIYAGRPGFPGLPGRQDWTPFFDPQTGLVEGLRKVDPATGQLKKRYTSWSRFFRQQYECNDDSVTNPFNFVSSDSRREQLLGLNWKAVATDYSDPTAKFEEGSMFVLFTLANLNKAHDELKGVAFTEMLEGFASGKSEFLPDYLRDGEVTVVAPDDTVSTIEDLDLAAEQVASGGVLFTNDFMQSWSGGRLAARLLAAELDENVIYIYMAKNILSLPWAENAVYRRRLEYVIAESIRRTSGASGLMVVSYGWSTHIMASVVAPYTNVVHSAVGPAPGPWGMAEFQHALGNAKGKCNLIVGGNDFVSLLGGGSSMEYPRKDCL